MGVERGSAQAVQADGEGGEGRAMVVGKGTKGENPVANSEDKGGVKAAAISKKDKLLAR